MLGFSQRSWDNDSGKEKQPALFDKYWDSLSHKERLAGVLLGYTGTSWDNDSGSELQPTSLDMSWFKLEACGEHFFDPQTCRQSLVLLLPPCSQYAQLVDSQLYIPTCLSLLLVRFGLLMVKLQVSLVYPPMS